MKALLLISLSLLSLSTFAQTRVILKDSLSTTAEVNDKTLRCSAKGYGLMELKINIHALDGWTILDHSNANFGEFNGEPCMTAGACQSFGSQKGFNLEEILKISTGLEKIRIDRVITEEKAIAINQNNDKVCRRTITETLNTVVANIPFHHARSFSQDFDEQVCH